VTRAESLTSLADSVAATRRALALQNAPLCWSPIPGGTVISETAMDPKVTALVYVGGAGPPARSGEDSLRCPENSPPCRCARASQDHDGFTYLSEEAFLQYFANGVRVRRRRSFMPSRKPTQPLSSPGGPR